MLSALPSPVTNTLSLPYANHLPIRHNQNPASTPQSLYVELAASWVSQSVLPSNRESWSSELQGIFEARIARLTVVAGLPLSWVDNPEWINFIHQFLPWAMSPSWKVLTTWLIPPCSQELQPDRQRILKGWKCDNSGWWMDRLKFSPSACIYDHCEQKGRIYASLPTEIFKNHPSRFTQSMYTMHLVNARQQRTWRFISRPGSRQYGMIMVHTLLVLSLTHQENAEGLTIYLHWSILILCSSIVMCIRYFFVMYSCGYMLITPSHRLIL